MSKLTRNWRGGAMPHVKATFKAKHCTPYAKLVRKFSTSWNVLHFVST
jgi:hypothetical protein